MRTVDCSVSSPEYILRRYSCLLKRILDAHPQLLSLIQNKNFEAAIDKLDTLLENILPQPLPFLATALKQQDVPPQNLNPFKLLLDEEPLFSPLFFQQILIPPEVVIRLSPHIGNQINEWVITGSIHYYRHQEYQATIAPLIEALNAGARQSAWQTSRYSNKVGIFSGFNSGLTLDVIQVILEYDQDDDLIEPTATQLSLS